MNSESGQWKERRAEILQRACSFIFQQLQDGARIGRAIRLAAKKFANADLGDGRRLALSEKTMQQMWYRWRASRDPAVFELKYNGASSKKLDPVLLRLLYEHCLQTGAPLTEAIEAVIPPGARFSIRELYRAIPKRVVDSFSGSQKQLAKKRAKIESGFLQSDARFRRLFVKQRLAFYRDLLKQDVRLRERLLRDREQLQRKFFQADARAVRQREQLQRKLLAKTIPRL